MNNTSTKDEVARIMGGSSSNADAFLTALGAAGYVVVPKEPTEDMADKGESSLICGPLPRDLPDSPSITWAHAKSCYRSMIAAALGHKV